MKYYKDLNKNMNSPTTGIDIGESESVAHFFSASRNTLEHFSFKINEDGFKAAIADFIS